MSKLKSIEECRDLFIIDEKVYYKQLIDKIGTILYPYYKKGFKIIKYDGELCDVRVPKDCDIGLREKARILRLAKEFVALQELIA